MNDVWIVGASMTPFARYPADVDLIDLAFRAATDAMADAGVGPADLGALAFGSAYEGGGNPGQRLSKQLGQTGVPTWNVINACATGAAAFRICHLAVKAGEADIALAVGAEKMGKTGLLGNAAKSGRGPVSFTASGRFGSVMGTEAVLGTNLMPGVFSHASTAYALEHGITFRQFAKVAEKNHANSVVNPLAQYQKAFSLGDIEGDEMIAWPNTKLMCCPSGDGAAAVLVCSADRLEAFPSEIRRRAVKVSASVLVSQPYTETDAVTYDINAITRLAASRAYEQAGVGPDDLDLVELHDCFASAELLHYDNLGLCEPGGAGDFVDRGGPHRGGTTPVNLSGGLLSKGHPIGATGLAGIYEVATHLRGEAGNRQQPDARVGLAHVLGLGSSCGVHILERHAS